jgi:3-oxoacyl-[acyl-carrier-protein] synthase II
MKLTGVGVTSAAGEGEAALFEAALAAVPLARPVSRYDVSGLGTKSAALVPDDVRASLEARWPGRDYAVQLALSAIEQATRTAPLDRRAGLFLGTSLGGTGSWEPWHRALVRGESAVAPRVAAHGDLAPAIAEELDLRGPVVTVSTACTSSAAALIMAADALAAGEIDRAIVVGVDAIGRFVHAGFDSLGALSPDDVPPVPFAQKRMGLWLGEGSAAVVLAREGEALARYLGGASTGDAVHVTAPDREGRGLARAITAALGGRTDVAWISAHATATKHNDAMEEIALRAVLGATLPPVHGLKTVTGHTLGACGLMEVVLATGVLARRVCPPTFGAESIVHANARPLGPGVLLSTNSAFAGNNTAIVLEGPAEGGPLAGVAPAGAPE